MRLAERDIGLADQPIGQVGRRGITQFRRFTHPPGAEGGAADHAFHGGKAERQQPGGFEDWRLVILHVL